MLTAAGLTKRFPWVRLRKLDWYHPAQGWETVDGAGRWLPLYSRRHLLPNGTVFMVGGREGTTGHAHDLDQYDEQQGALPLLHGAIHEAELFGPESESWGPMASMQVDRLYHSGALLLPDGRVMTSGSNPTRRVDELRIETCRPPSLFQGPRPAVESAPGSVTSGDRLAVESPDAADVDEVVLVRQCSTTHCLRTDQRLVELPIAEQTADSVEAAVPDNPNLLPPIYYMCFLLRDGVPSTAPFVRVGHG